MVHEIMETKRMLFLEALVLTVLILIIGFFLGFSVEQHRQSKVITDYKTFEVEALDLKLQNYYYQIMDSSSCQEAINQNLIFADKIYNTGLMIEDYESSGELLKSALLTEKKKYVLLKTELWLNSILLRNKCNNSFHTVVYLYSQNPDSIKEAKQAAISKTLADLKKEYGNKIILIPLAGDLGLDSVDLQERIYGIDSLPAVLIDEKYMFSDYTSLDKLASYVSK